MDFTSCNKSAKTNPPPSERLPHLLSSHKEHLDSPLLDNNLPPEEETFEAIADRLADEFQMYVGATPPVLSDYAVSRAGIYEDYP